MVDTFDEELHEPDDVPHWQESYYFNWADTDGRSYGLTRIGFYESGTKGDGLVLTIRDGIPESLYGAIGVDISPPAHLHEGRGSGEPTRVRDGRTASRVADHTRRLTVDKHDLACIHAGIRLRSGRQLR
ncbi:MAG: hypothetical protein R2735_03395 [Microthrixaceae bacterium]